MCIRDRQWYDDTTADTDTPPPQQQQQRVVLPRAIPCLDSLRYEPYVVVPWCTTTTTSTTTTTPYYDERFHGYGKNKIQYLFHLRMLAYQFRVLPEGFLVHVPHATSHTKELWNDQLHHQLHQEMDALYTTFLQELVHRLLYYQNSAAGAEDKRNYNNNMLELC